MTYLWIAPCSFEKVALTTSRIYLMIYLIDITLLTKYVIKLANN